ncbi:hypothetical protein GE061_018595 [Apolygus lucorum]|uniref:Uncharacterized protein n=1 Tax=Apolygus lucorum TaxID=248454 RepID=A0A8S9XFP1_APOLU|nr:hypothetical protein GE061_018595 [Apolygus lucorum]
MIFENKKNEMMKMIYIVIKGPVIRMSQESLQLRITIRNSGLQNLYPLKLWIVIYYIPPRSGGQIFAD